MDTLGLNVDRDREPDELIRKTSVGLDIGSLKETNLVHLVANTIRTGNVLAFLVELVSGRRAPLSFPICVTGRAPESDLMIVGDDSISRAHFAIEYLENTFWLSDQGSKNGTFLNGEPIKRKVLLNDGDTIRAGRTRLKFVSSSRTQNDLSEEYEALKHVHQTLSRELLHECSLDETMDLPGGEED